MASVSDTTHVVRDVTQDLINANKAKLEAAHEDVCYTKRYNNSTVNTAILILTSREADYDAARAAVLAAALANANEVDYVTARDAACSAALSVNAAYDSVRVAVASVDKAAARVADFALAECKGDYDDARTVARTAARVLDDARIVSHTAARVLDPRFLDHR